MNKQVIIATNNQHKLEEVTAVLSQLLPDVNTLSLKDINFNDDIEEYGTTFYQNALIKAETIAKIHPNKIVIADDSGLEVATLNGEPGVYSARYASDSIDYKKDKDSANNAKLLRMLSTEADRSACFKTVLAIIIPNQEPIFVSGSVAGEILTVPRGENGFGYDPLFTADKQKSFAELSAAEKNQLSHRANALVAMAKLNIWQEL